MRFTLIWCGFIFFLAVSGLEVGAHTRFGAAQPLSPTVLVLTAVQVRPLNPIGSVYSYLLPRASNTCLPLSAVPGRWVFPSVKPGGDVSPGLELVHHLCLLVLGPRVTS